MLPAGGDRESRAVRQGSAAGVRARFRGEPGGRAQVREVQEAHHLPLDLRGLRHVPRRRAQRGDKHPGLRPDRQAALDLRQLEATARPGHLRLRRARRASTTRCSARSTGSGPSSTTSSSPRKAARGCSPSSSRMSSSRSRSSSSTAANRGGRSRSSTMASTRSCASSRTRTAAPPAASSTSAIRRTT